MTKDALGVSHARVASRTQTRRRSSAPTATVISCSPTIPRAKVATLSPSLSVLTKGSRSKSIATWTLGYMARLSSIPQQCRSACAACHAAYSCRVEPGPDSGPGPKADSGLQTRACAQVGGRLLTTFSADHYTGIKLSITDLPVSSNVGQSIARAAATTERVQHHPPPAPPFDGALRPCKSDPERVDAWLAAPPCPSEVKECKASSNHCASLEMLPSGALALAWFSGYREGWDRTGPVIAYLEAGATRWSDPIILSRTQGFSSQNPVLFYDEGTLWAFHTRQPSRDTGTATTHAVLASTDDPVPSQETMGRMWVQSVQVPSSRPTTYGGMVTPPSANFTPASLFLGEVMCASRGVGWLVCI